MTGILSFPWSTFPWQSWRMWCWWLRPAANVIAKLAHGLADDMLTTTVLACTCKKIISPAMNTRMFENPITQDNLRICERYGMEVISPASGYLACGDTGAGKMPEPEVLLQYILKEIRYEKDLAGKKILVTAGPTREAIDPVALHHQPLHREDGIRHCEDRLRTGGPR